MNCPYCGKDNNVVADSHQYNKRIDHGECIRRKRKCVECGRFFWTTEEIYLSGSGIKEPQKLKYGYAIIDTENNSKFCKGVKVEILGKSKTYNQYYVRPIEGTVQHWVDAEDLVLIGG